MSARPPDHPLDPATTPVTITEHQLLQQLEPGSNTAKLFTGPKHILCFFTSGCKIFSMTLAKDVTFEFIFRQLSSSLKRAIDLGALPSTVNVVSKSENESTATYHENDILHNLLDDRTLKHGDFLSTSNVSQFTVSLCLSIPAKLLQKLQKKLGSIHLLFA